MIDAERDALLQVPVGKLEPAALAAERGEIAQRPPRVLRVIVGLCQLKTVLQHADAGLVAGYEPGGADVVGGVDERFGVAFALSQLDRLLAPLDGLIRLGGQHLQL